MSDIEAMAQTLDAHEDYRILRRLKPRSAPIGELPEGVKKGVMLDTEGTGIDVATDEVVELSMVPFLYTSDGRIVGVLEPFEAFREPSFPIPDEVVALTGITNEMVAGTVIDPALVEAFLQDVDIVIAHHSKYDRRMVERLWPVFATKCWGCTLDQVDWRSQGRDGKSLSALLAAIGYFHDGHRGTVDCHAGIEIMATELKDGRTALAHLLDAARKPSILVHATNSPYAKKDDLKKRGYRWGGDDAKPPKCWTREVAADDAQAEVEYLQTTIYGRPVSIPTTKINAFDRFSVRSPF